MKNLVKRMSSSVLTLLVLALAFGSLASAQATRTWVSGVGDDVNPCSRTAPCKTFAGAISKTAAAGEIDCLDPGGFGAVTITKAITIDCTHVSGGVLSSGTNGIVINATGATDSVVLRNLVIQGAGTGLDGIKILAAFEVHLEDVDIKGVTLAGVEVAASANVNLTMQDCTISEAGSAGVSLTTTSGLVNAQIDNLHVSHTHPAIAGLANNLVTVSNSDLSYAFKAIKQSASGSVINVINCTMVGNSVATLESNAGSTINASGNTIAQSPLGINSAGGTISSDGTNIFLGNTTNGTFNGTAISKF